MRKPVVVVAGLTVCLACAIFAQQQQPDWDKVQIRVQKLSANMYMLESQGQPANVGIGNIAVFASDDGLVIVDSMLVELGPKIDAALKTTGRVYDGRGSYHLPAERHSGGGCQGDSVRAQAQRLGLSGIKKRQRRR